MNLPEILVGVDIEELTVAYLRAALQVPVSTIVQEGPDGQPRHPLFMRVVASGGLGRFAHVLDKANVTIEAWGVDSVAASRLARLAEAHLRFWPYTDARVKRIEQFSAPANLPDPVSGMPRYITSFEITTRAVETP